MCGCPVSGYQASYRESESEHVFATGHASSVAGSRVRSDARPTTASMGGSNSHRSSPASSTNGQVEKRGGVPRADQRFAPLHRPARVLIRIRFAFWLRAGSAPSPIRDRPVPGGKLSVDRILPAARDRAEIRSATLRNRYITTAMLLFCTRHGYCFVNHTGRLAFVRSGFSFCT